MYRRSRKHQQGSSILELSLAVFLLLMALTGTMDFGRVFYLSTEVANAARAGVQWAAIHPGQPVNFSAMQTAATSDAANITGMSATASEFCECDDGSSIACSTGTCTTGSLRTYVKVVTSAPYSTVGTYPWLPNPITVKSQAILRVD